MNATETLNSTPVTIGPLQVARSTEIIVATDRSRLAGFTEARTNSFKIKVFWPSKPGDKKEEDNISSLLIDRFTKQNKKKKGKKIFGSIAQVQSHNGIS